MDYLFYNYTPYSSFKVYAIIQRTDNLYKVIYEKVDTNYYLKTFIRNGTKNELSGRFCINNNKKLHWTTLENVLKEVPDVEQVFISWL